MPEITLTQEQITDIISELRQQYEELCDDYIKALTNIYATPEYRKDLAKHKVILITLINTLERA